MEKNLLIWLHYHTGRNTNLLDEADTLIEKYKKDTSGDNERCECENTGKAVNRYWKDWHCTTCLKPTEL